MLWVALSVVLAFGCGWMFGLLFEYLYHWLAHKLPTSHGKNHMRHHKEFFKLESNDVARNARCLGGSLVYAAVVFALLTPLVFLIGWLAVLCFFAGAFWHLVIVYEVAHATIHHDAWLPEVIRKRKFYQWWRRCHLAHHWDKPHLNMSVTSPFIMDVLLGTFAWPRDSYPPLPRKRGKDNGKSVDSETDKDESKDGE